jgi:murein DD-endopeptidase MepM/ murein hydrolase activator NlpD
LTASGLGVRIRRVSVRRPGPGRATGLVAALLAASAAASLAAASSQPGRPGRASGFGATLDGRLVAADANLTRPNGVADAVSGPAGAIGRVEVHVTGSREAAVSRVEVTTRARDVLLFGGRVAIGSLRLTVISRAAPGDLERGITDYGATAASVDGQPVEAAPGRQVALPGIGTLVLFERVTEPDGSVRANALRVEVDDPSSGFPVGTQIVVGHAEARAILPAPAATPAPAPRPAPAPGGSAPAAGGAPSSEGGGGAGGAGTLPGALPTPTPVPTRPLPGPQAPQLAPVPQAVPLPGSTTPSAGAAASTAGTYVFPVYGASVSFSDDYGAPRAGTGWHHGNDIFAPIGTPVLAVADGVLSKVGQNTLGGNRLWLTDQLGNTYYYAHLSAFAPGTADGAAVRAGEVIAFVGNTGQASTTPSHLHFEVHPGGGDSVDPYPYLLAWQRSATVPRAFEAATVARGQAPAVGALLVGVAAAADGLGDVALEPGDGLAHAVP